MRLPFKNKEVYFTVVPLEWLIIMIFVEDHIDILWKFKRAETIIIDERFKDYWVSIFHIEVIENINENSILIKWRTR